VSAGLYFNDGDSRTPFDAAHCIASDDPRLKEK
jgi:hypothetical protein